MGSLLSKTPDMNYPQTQPKEQQVFKPLVERTESLNMHMNVHRNIQKEKEKYDKIKRNAAAAAAAAPKPPPLPTAKRPKVPNPFKNAINNARNLRAKEQANNSAKLLQQNTKNQQQIILNRVKETNTKEEIIAAPTINMVHPLNKKASQPTIIPSANTSPSISVKNRIKQRVLRKR